MHPFIKISGLTLANCAAIGCAALALFCYGWNGSLLEAALPLTLFILFCVFEPWLLIVCALCGVGLWHANLFPLKEFFVFGYTLILTALFSLFTRRFYQRLYLRGKLNRVLRYQAGIKVGIAGVLGLALLVSYAGYKDFPKQHAVPTNVLEWPFYRFCEEGVTPSATNAYSYDLPYVYGQGALDGQRLWQIHVSRAEMAHFVAVSEMPRVPETAFSSYFWNKPPYWWRRPKGKVEAYKYDNFSESGKFGMRSESAVYDPQTETLFLWEQWANHH